MGKVTVGGHWLVEEKIGEGSFGEVFRAVHVKTKEQCAIKRELITEEHPQLPQEAEFLKMLEGPSFIPKVHWFGQEKLYNALVMDLLGPNMRLVRQAYDKLPVSFVSDIAIQMVTILEHVHKKGIVYRDVKPDNFLLERDFAISIKELEKWDSENSPRPLEDYRPLLGRTHKISLVDFGLSTFYIDKRTKRHVPRKQPPTKYKTGTARYAAIGVHHGLPHARRDDLESLGYVILEMLRGTLPWAGVTARNAIEGWAKMLKMKSNIPLEELFEGVPRGFMDYLQYARGLDFEQEPDYNYARNLLMSAANDGYDSELVYAVGIEDCFSSRPMSPSPSTPANELCFWNDADNAFRDFDGGYHSDEWINHNDDNAVMAEVSAWDGNVKVPWLEENFPARNWHPRCVEEQRTRSLNTRELRDLQSRRPSVPSPLSISIPPRPNSAMNTSRGVASPNNKFDSSYYPGVNENIPLAPRRSIPNIRNTNSLATRFLKRSVPNLRDQARHNTAPQSSKRIMPHMQDKKGNNSSRCYSFKDNLPYSSSQPTTPREEINNPMLTQNVKYSPQDARFSLKDSRYSPQDARFSRENFRGRERANTFSQFSNISRHSPLPSSPSTPSRQGSKSYKDWERSHTFTNGHDSPVSPGIQNNSPNSPYSSTNNWLYNKRDRSYTFANGGRPKDNNYGGKNRPAPLGQLPSRNYVNCQPQNNLQQNSGYNRNGTNNVQKIRQNNHQEENYPPRSASTTPTCGHRRSNSQEKIDLKKQIYESSKANDEPTVTSPSVAKASHPPFFDQKIINDKNQNSMNKEMSNNSQNETGNSNDANTSNDGSVNKQANQQHNHVTFANVEDNYSYYPDRPSNSYRRQSFSAVNVEEKPFRTRSLTTLPDLRQDKDHTAVSGKSPRSVLKNNNQSVTNVTPKDNFHFQDTEKKKKKKKKWGYYYKNYN